MMQVMDIFPQITTKLDPGAAARYLRQDANRTQRDTQFADVMSSVRGSAVRESAGQTRSSDTRRTSKTERTEESAKDTAEPIDTRGMEEETEDDAEETDDVMAMSVLMQNNVVLILEGNKEIEAAPETPVSIDCDIGIAPAAAENGEEPVTAPVPQTQLVEDTQSDDEAEQMARMPEAGTIEAPREKKAEESDGDDLCPLENENEVTETGKKDNTPRVAQTAEDKPVEDDNIQERIIPTHQTIDVRPERLSSQEQLNGVAAQQPVSQENLFEAMVEKIETMQADGESRMSIQLKPEYLGKVSLQLSMTEQGLQVRINADDLNVRHAIGGQINALIETLQGKGFAVAEVEVLYTGAGSYDFTNGQGGNAQPQQSAPSRRYGGGAADDMSDFEIPEIGELQSVLDEELSSVEYRA